MKIIQTNIIRGPNIWSIRRKKLIVLKVDLEEHSETYTNTLPQFAERLVALIPSLKEHRCSKGVEGGFIERLHEGTLLGHVIEHVALEIQTLAGMFCGFGRARETSQRGIFNVVFAYEIEEAGLYAGKMAFKIIDFLAKNKEVEELNSIIEHLKSIHSKYQLGPSTESIINEAKSRNIPYANVNRSLFILGQGSQQKLFSATLAHHTSSIGIDLVGDKATTKELLQNEFIPVPTGACIHTLDELEAEIDYLGYPLVVKPRYGNHGRGITTNIQSKNEAFRAFRLAKEISSSIIVERFIEGSDFRFLLINFRFVAAARRTPPYIVGDGSSTIKALIDEENSNPLRGQGHENILTKIHIDEMTETILCMQNLTLDSVLPINKVLYLKDTANISTGGTATDVTDEVHPFNIFLAERIARLVNLDVCGIDLIAKNVSVPFTSSNCAVLEVNAAPGFRMHLAPTVGRKRNVAKPFIDMLFPQGLNGRIPIVAVTGTNGKTTIVSLIAHIAEENHYTVGMTTTEGIYINKKQIYQGDCSGPRSGRVILKDPTVDFAVLECARGGIIRGGLAFDQCDIGVVSNISADHLGLSDVHTLSELAFVKSVVPQSVAKDGFAILNADDELVYGMRIGLQCKTAFFSMSKSERITQHLAKGDWCCYVDEDAIYLSNGILHHHIIAVEDIPITFKGISQCMIQNVLSAILACFLQRISLDIIIKGLKNFVPSAENLPGRMNTFKFPHCEILIDYAHNEQAYIELNKYVSKVKAKKKIAIIAGTGDRKDSDIRKTGYYSAQLFDEIIIREDLDRRGREKGEINNLILEGIRKVNPHKTVRVIEDEYAALQYAIDNGENAFIWYFPEKVLPAIKYTKKLIKEYTKSQIS